MRCFRRPFRAVATRERDGNVIPYPKFRPVKPPRHRARRRAGWSLAVLPLAAITAVLLWEGGPPGLALPVPSAPSADRHAARFASCANASHDACVIDGDTFWYRGEKIRIADINTPETGEPRCAEEAELGARATARLTELLNAGAFSLEPVDREADKYGRTLRVVTRAGESLGATLDDEGLAEPWQGHRRDWC